MDSPVCVFCLLFCGIYGFRRSEEDREEDGVYCLKIYEVYFFMQEETSSEPADRC